MIYKVHCTQETEEFDMDQLNNNYDELRKVVVAFRKAIVTARENRDFDRKDRISNFPGGCCDDACDLLSYYLYDKFGIRTTQGNGLYDDGVFENRTNHAWLVMDDGTVIDITGTQFRFCAGFTEEVYIGQESSFYRGLERKTMLENYDIRQSKRLWTDYQIILGYLEEGW